MLLIIQIVVSEKLSFMNYSLEVGNVKQKIRKRYNV